MLSVQKSLIHCFVKPSVESDLPGRLRLRFAYYSRLPDQARPFLQYIEALVRLHPSVLECRFNPRIGTLLIVYDRARDAQSMLAWLHDITDACIAVVENLDPPLPGDGQLLFELVRARLQALLRGKVAC